LNAPLSPQPEKGRTFVYNNHGTFHYITKLESELKDGLAVLEMISIFGGVIGIVLEKKA
jgi:hypothetical protein